MPDQNSHPNPYVGPRAFKTGEKIYGRDVELRNLLDLLIAERIVLLHSPSGAGKTSLIQAGLIPRLQEESFRVLPPVRVYLEPPVSLSKPVNRYVFSVLLSLEECLPEEQRFSLEDLAGLTLDAYLSQLPREAGEPDTDVLLFDQFEEILSTSLTDTDAKTEFFAQLGTALRNRKRWALVSMREDYVAALDPYLRALPTQLRSNFRLDRLDPRSAMQAIQAPARETGVEFTDRAAKILVDDLRRVRVQSSNGNVTVQPGPYVEPVQLQVVCYRIWESRNAEDQRIEPEAVHSIGDVDTALADYYAERVKSAADTTGMSERSIREWFDHQLITEQGIRGQVLMGQQESGKLDNQAIRWLENAHLVRGEKRGGATWFELAHDRLIEPIRRDNAAWIQKNLNLFQRTADIWQRQDRPDSLLLRENELASAETWAAAHKDELLQFEKEFLQASQEVRDREEQARALVAQKLEAERMRAEEQEIAARRLAARNRIISIVSALLLVLVIVAVYFAYQSDRNARVAQQQTGIAKANASTAQANEQIARMNQKTAQAASTEAFNQKSRAESAGATAIADRAIAQAASTQAIDQSNIAATAQADSMHSLQDKLVGISRGLANSAFTYLNEQPDLSLLLSIEALRTTYTPQAASGLLTGIQQGLKRKQQPFQLKPPAQNFQVSGVAFSPDGKSLAWSGADGSITLWNVNEGKVTDHVPAHAGMIYSLAFSPKGNSIASGGIDDTLVLWDLVSKTTQKIGFPNSVRALSYNPKGSKLAIAVGPQVQILDLNSGELEPPLKKHNNDILSLSWSPDGNWLVSGDKVGNVYLWETASWGAVPMQRQSEGIDAIAWSPDNARIAYSGQGASIVIWDRESKKAVGKPLRGHTGHVLSLAFSRDGHTLASGGSDGVVVLWDAASFQVIDRIRDNRAAVSSLSFSSRGKNLLSSGSLDRTVGIYEITIDQPLYTGLDSKISEVKALAFTDPATLWLAGNLDGDITVVEAQNGEITPGLSLPGEASAMAIDPASQRLATGSKDGAISVMDLQTGDQISAPTSTAGSIGQMTFSSDSTILALVICSQQDSAGTCQHSEVAFIDVSSGANLNTLDVSQAGPDLSIAFDPSGKFLVTGGADGTVRFWDIESGDSAGRSINTGTAVTGLAFTGDGKLIAVANADETLSLWDATSRQRIGEPLDGDIGIIGVLAPSPAGTLAAAGESGAVAIWDIKFESWIERACRLAGRNFSNQEWDQFFPGQQYVQTCPQYPIETPTPATPAPTP